MTRIVYDMFSGRPCPVCGKGDGDFCGYIEYPLGPIDSAVMPLVDNSMRLPFFHKARFLNATDKGTTE